MERPDDTSRLGHGLRAALPLRYLRRMGRTVWCFWLDEREAHRIPCRTYQRIMSGDDALPALATRTVPIVEAILEVDRRTVLALLATTCWRHTFDRRGYVDRTRADEGRRLAVSTLVDGMLANARGSNVRTIVPQLAERRLAREFRGVLTSAQWQALLRTIWKE